MVSMMNKKADAGREAVLKYAAEQLCATGPFDDRVNANAERVRVYLECNVPLKSRRSAFS